MDLTMALIILFIVSAAINFFFISLIKELRKTLKEREAEEKEAYKELRTLLDDTEENTTIKFNNHKADHAFERTICAAVVPKKYKEERERL